MTRTRLFLGGDVMTGRGIDQILAHPSKPALHEPFVRDARDYVTLAEEVNGAIPRAVSPEYVWGDLLALLEEEAPAARIVNLETAITRHDEPELGKSVHYRMEPANVGCLTAARLDVCVLANNHMLDWGRPGLLETLDALAKTNIAVAGAGRTLEEARWPAVACEGRVLVFGLGDDSSGIAPDWRAGANAPGIELLEDLSDRTADAIGERIRARKRRGDVAVVSVHWGSNWGYEVPRVHARFAHALVDRGADVVHGHSSHHPRPIEVYRDKLVLYGCGDLLNDYEGIRGHAEYRSHLVLGYVPALDDDGQLVELRMLPLRTRKLRLERASADEAQWLAQTLARTSEGLGVGGISVDEAGRLVAHPRR